MRFGVLGPLQVTAGDSDDPGVVPAARPRALLAALLWRASQPVPVDELAELVWDGAPPGKARVHHAAALGRASETGAPRGLGGTGRNGPARPVPLSGLDLRRPACPRPWLGIPAAGATRGREIMPVPAARVWQRYGQLRIYVSVGDVELGWYDPRSGRFQLRQPAMAEDFWSAVHGECGRLMQEGRLARAAPPAGTQDTAPAAGPPGSGEPASTHWVVRDPRWNDLARNEPGESARARAKELRAEHPLMVTAAKALGIRTAAESFAVGARGERKVGRKLNRWATRDGWHVLHAVPVGQAGADIDHVVIGSFGVVTVNTKTTRTSVWVGEHGMALGGKSVDYLRKSRAEARRAGRLLAQATRIEVPVQPVIVFTGARRFSVRRGGPQDVAVFASPSALRRWLHRQPAVLDTERAEAVYQAARSPATWQGRGARPS